MIRTAYLSEDRTYRYELWRVWGAGRIVVIIGLNPSTADEEVDDPTITREIAFAKSWGFAGLCKVNLFAYRATQPADMRRAADPVGPLNDEVLRSLSGNFVVAAWGVHGTHRRRDEAVRAMFPQLHYLRLTKDGHPSHPLYLPGNLTPQPWTT